MGACGFRVSVETWVFVVRVLAGGGLGASAWVCFADWFDYVRYVGLGWFIVLCCVIQVGCGWLLL